MRSIRRWFVFLHMSVIAALMLSIPTGCDYGRMNDQDSIKTYEKKVTTLDKRSIPVSNSFAVLSSQDPRSLHNPLPHNELMTEQGRLAYNYFCVQCHGVKLDGKGTVGQSFSPLPANLLSPATLSLPDGVIYSRIRLGYKRHPVLFSTVPAEDAWAIIMYTRSLGSSNDP